MLTEEERKQHRRESKRRYREKNKEKLKKKSKAYNKKRYWEHKKENQEKHNQEQREYYDKHKDEICEALRELYASDDEYRNKVLERNKKFKQDNPQYMQDYRDAHKEETYEYNKEYLHSQRGRANSLLNAYRKNDRNHNRGKCTITVDWIIENIFNIGKCTYCKKEFDWTELGCDRKDSSLPHTPNNCVPCCQSCNSKKGTMSYEEYMIKILGAPNS